ncbi:MAG: N-acyl homoserine lactonase family protein [Eggerthellaceae bacterium]|nr:N-acyl homoserine lactonase family protein [Eggerthellaceae bacterium]
MEGMKVYVIDTGRLHNDMNLTFAQAVQATRDNPNPDIKWLHQPTYCALIQHPDAGWILFDIGTNPDVNEQVTPGIGAGWYHTIDEEDQTMVAQLAKLGLKPEDINYVVMSHMHIDHIGNVELFKDTAEFFVSRAEAQHAFCAVKGSLDPATYGFYYKPHVLADVKKYHYVEEDEEIFEGIETILIPGHTPGMMGLYLHLEDQDIILASDGCFGSLIWDDGKLPGSCGDTGSFVKSVKKLKKLQKKNNAMVWFGHDLEQFNNFKKIPEYYK